MKLLDEQPEVKDKPDAAILQVENGEIEFGVFFFSAILFISIWNTYRAV